MSQLSFIQPNYEVYALLDELRRTFKSFGKKYPDLIEKYNELLQAHLKRGMAAYKAIH
jgi:hypothetical protein